MARVSKAAEGPRPASRVPKKPTRSKLISSLDTVFSVYVRSKDADRAGRVECYTCGISKPWKEVDAGHFQTRAKYSTRWDEQNVKPQCKHCNMTNGGHQYQFAIHLDQEYGPGTADEVVRRSNQMRKYSAVELKELISLYLQKVSEL